MDIEKRKAQIRAEILKKYKRSQKEDYLLGIGIFKASAISEMKIEQINELMESALKVKGF